MNAKDMNALAAQIQLQPDLLIKAETAAIRELLLDHSAGLLSEEALEEAERLIETHPTAAAIWSEFKAIDEHLETSEGKAQTEKALGRLIQELHTSEGIMPLDPNGVSNAQKPEIIPFPQPETTFRWPWKRRVPQRLAASTELRPIHGFGGPNQVVSYTMEGNEAGETEIYVRTTDAAWSKLDITLGEETKPLEMQAFGSSWGGSVTFPRQFSLLEKLLPEFRPVL